MADSKAKIKASFTAPDHKIVNGVKVDLTAEEVEAMLDKWTDNEHARQVDEEANGYKRARATAYPSVVDFMEAYTEKEIGGDSTKWDAYVVNYNKVRSDNPKG